MPRRALPFLPLLLATLPSFACGARSGPPTGPCDRPGPIHVYAEGFGSTLETHVAPAPEGPWTPSSSIGACALPAADGHAFCAGPVVHPEITDPTRPGEVVVSYGVGTTAQDQDQLRADRPRDYWTRLVWSTMP